MCVFTVQWTPERYCNCSAPSSRVLGGFKTVNPKTLLRGVIRPQPWTQEPCKASRGRTKRKASNPLCHNSCGAAWFFSSQNTEPVYHKAFPVPSTFEKPSAVNLRRKSCPRKVHRSDQQVPQLTTLTRSFKPNPKPKTPNPKHPTLNTETQTLNSYSPTIHRSPVFPFPWNFEPYPLSLNPKRRNRKAG